jgi:hypothetical protein
MEPKVVKLSELKPQLIQEGKNLAIIELIDNYSLNPIIKISQLFYLIHLYYRAYPTLYQLFANLFKNKASYPWTKEEVDDLYYSGFIDSTWTNSVYPDIPVLTKKGNNYIINVLNVTENKKADNYLEFGEDLFSTYPNYFSNGYPTKNFTKIQIDQNKFLEGKYSTLEYYYKLINGDRDLHNEIIGKVKFALVMNGDDNKRDSCKAIHTTLIKFIVNKNWEKIKLNDSTSITKIG